MTNLNLSQDMVIMTVIDQNGLGNEMLGMKKAFFRDGSSGKFPLPWLEKKTSELARNYLEKGNFDVLEIFSPERQEQKVTLMVDPYLPPPELIILGGGHIALPLTKIACLLGYRIIVVDDRPDFVSANRFSEADKVIYCSFGDIGDNLDFGMKSSVVIITRGHKHDLECLRQVVKYPLAYIGMIGSRRRISMVKEQLFKEGFDAEDINKVHMPIGLDIGAQTPGEIAVSIAAELIKTRRGGKASSLSGNCAGTTVPVKVLSEMPSALDREILKKVLSASQEGTPAAIATIIKTRGSTPRKAGARMLVYSDCSTFGTIGGGYVELEVRQKAINVIYENIPAFYKVTLDADMAAMEGMACGGYVEVFIEPVSSFDKVFKKFI